MAAGNHPAAWWRPLRRLFRPFLNQSEKRRIAGLIAEMESGTSAEIHVHVIARAKEDMLALAPKIFRRLGLEKTDQRNGVLILISHLDHRFCIWGDEGIHAKAGSPFWERAKRTLTEHFASRRYSEGIEACVREVGGELAVHFPKKAGPGSNQLSNEVTGR